jgi:hypothetical protein
MKNYLINTTKSQTIIAAIIIFLLTTALMAKPYIFIFNSIAKGEQTMFSDEHNCGHEFVIMKSMSNLQEYVFIDDRPESPTFGTNLIECPTCKQGLRKQDFKKLAR